MTDLTAQARAIIDGNRYMTLATANEDGHPWASPVWYAHENYSEFLWVSKPGARHSQNLAGRPQLGIVIFDSTVPEGAAEAVYMEAIAEQVADDELAPAMAVFSARSVATFGESWTTADVTAPAPHRLYRARALEHFVLDSNDQRIPVEL